MEQQRPRHERVKQIKGFGNNQDWPNKPADIKLSNKSTATWPESSGVSHREVGRGHDCSSNLLKNS